MSHRYIELFLNSTGGSSGMSLGGIGNFCGGMSANRKHFFTTLHSFSPLATIESRVSAPPGLGNNFRPGYSPNRGFSSQLGGNNYNSF